MNCFSWISPDECLVRRSKKRAGSTPLSTVGEITEGIMKERTRLQDIRGRATKIIDTSELTPPQLREQVRERLPTANQVPWLLRYCPSDSNTAFP